MLVIVSEIMPAERISVKVENRIGLNCLRNLLTYATLIGRYGEGIELRER